MPIRKARRSGRWYVPLPHVQPIAAYIPTRFCFRIGRALKRVSPLPKEKHNLVRAKTSLVPTRGEEARPSTPRIRRIDLSSPRSKRICV